MEQQNQINLSVHKLKPKYLQQEEKGSQQNQKYEQIKSFIDNLMQQAFRKLNDGLYEKSQRVYKQCLQLQQQIYGRESIQIAQTLHKISIVKIYQQLYYQAIKYCVQSLSIKQIVVGKNDERYITTLYNLGSIYRDLCKYQKSLQIYKKCLQLCDTKKSILYADILNRIGLLNEIQGLYDSALENLLNSMKIYQFLEKFQYQGYGHVLNNIGFVYEQMHQYNYAIKFYYCSLEVYKKLFPQGQNSFNECIEKTERNLGNAIQLHKNKEFQLLK